MGESFINLSEGSGKKAHTYQRTIGANTVEDDIVVQGLPYLATYDLEFTGLTTATAASHIIQIMAGASLLVYVMRVTLWLSAPATAAAFCEWSFRRLTTAGTGGTGRSWNPYDQNDSAASATGMSLPTVKGTEGAVSYRTTSYMTQTPGAGGLPMVPIVDYIADANGLMKPIKIGAGTSNGLAIRNDTAIAGATVSGTIVIVEANF